MTLTSNIPIVTKGVYPCINTAPQSTLASKQRHNNVIQAFAINKYLADQRIAIIDDVMTIDHTANTLTKALKNNVVKSVFVWGIARARLTQLWEHSRTIIKVKGAPQPNG